MNSALAPKREEKSQRISSTKWIDVGAHDVVHATNDVHRLKPHYRRISVISWSESRWQKGEPNGDEWEKKTNLNVLDKYDGNRLMIHGN